MTPELLSRLRLKVAEELGATWGPWGPEWSEDPAEDESLRVLRDAGGFVAGWQYHDDLVTWREGSPDWPNSLDACMRDLRCEGGQTIALIPQAGFTRAVLMEGPDALLDDPTQPGVCRALWGDEYDAPTPAVAYVLCWLASRGVDVSEFQESGE